MSGLAGGWLVWTLVTALIMVFLCLLISLVTRHFLAGVAMVVVTVSLILLLILAGAAAGMAQSDFGLDLVVPYAVLAAAVAAGWLLLMKARPQKS